VITHNPLAGFKLEGYSTPERNVWSPAQVRTFLQRAEGEPLAALFRIALGYGLRRGELLGLRWEDLDLTAGTLAVRQQVGWFDGEPAIGPPKTKGSRRSFSLDADTVAVLRQLRHERRIVQLHDAWGLVFAAEDGKPLRPYVPLFTLKRIAEEAGLPALTLHELRHTAATNMLAAGVPPKVVSERLGHATVAMTLDTYGHVLLEQDQDAAAKIGGILG
jgi:integrase